MSRLSKEFIGLVFLTAFIFVSIIGLPLSVHYNLHIDPICFAMGSHCLNGIEHINNWQASFVGLIGIFSVLIILMFISWHSHNRPGFNFWFKNFTRTIGIYNDLPSSLFRILTQPNL